MLYVKKSLLRNAGEGLFAQVDLPVNTVFPVRTVGIIKKSSSAVDILEKCGFKKLD